MKKLLLFLILLATPLLGTASHIVGGEFELVHITGYRYRLNMVIYFDERNGDQGAKDLGGEDVRIFRMFDNAFMMNVHVPYDKQVPVEYTQIECQREDLKTTKITYTTEITLPPTVFNHPKGYYIAWERCCRNYGITNIFSQNATTGWAGQTFYLAFPPVMKDGRQFVDSTPRLFPPLSDYACAGKPYYADFGGIDDDGDSLVYSMAVPLSTGTNDPVPPITPQPYPEVTWRTPFSISNIMNGTPDLRISRDGLLRVTPTLLGLFVFAVKVEEFRNKIKIGETRRDFQMLVLDCPVAVPPVIVGRKKGQTAYQAHNLVADYSQGTVTDADRCIEIQITDEDSNNAQQGFQEKIRIKVVPLNFKKSLSGMNFTATEAILTHGNTANFTICFSDCPFIIGDAIIGVIAMDDACSLPLMDTLKVTVRIPPPPNSKPYFLVPGPNPYNATVVGGNEFFSATVHQNDASGNQLITPFTVVDDDAGDVIDISVVTDGFALADAGMTVTSSPQVGHQVTGQLKWDVFCQLYDFTKRTDFRVTILAEDRDRCLLADPARAVHSLKFDPPTNSNPVIMTDLTSTHERSITGITRHIDEPLNFKIKGSDADGDFLRMTGAAKDFSLGAYGISIDPSVTTGAGVTNSTFQWTISCASVDLKKKDTFDFRFVVVDSLNLCHFRKADTVDVQVKVLPPVNHPPLLTITNQNSPATLYYNNGIDMVLGPTIKLLLTGTDADVLPGQDNLKIDIVSATGNVKPKGYTFTPVTGKSPIQTSLVWQPDCSIFEEAVYQNEYDFIFTITDDHCISAKTDSVKMKLKIRDIESGEADFIPPNFFSPNGDGVNDYFAMEMMNDDTGAIRNVLPKDNCYSHFESVRIYNRWGNPVFESANREFRWDAKGESAGVYFYFLKFTKKEYRGTVSLRY